MKQHGVGKGKVRRDNRDEQAAQQFSHLEFKGFVIQGASRQKVSGYKVGSGVGKPTSKD